MREPEQKAVDFVRELASKAVEDNIECVLLFGSALHDDNPRDIDVFVLLKSYKPNDLPLLREATKDFPLVDLHVQWLNDLNRQKSLRFGNQGAYFGQILSRSKVLYGINPFGGLVEMLSDNDKEDLRRKVAEYVFRLDQMFMRTDGKAQDLTYLRKYLIRICLDLLLLSGELKPRDLHAFSLGEAEALILDSRLCRSRLPEVGQFLADLEWSAYPAFRKSLYGVFLSL